MEILEKVSMESFARCVVQDRIAMLDVLVALAGAYELLSVAVTLDVVDDALARIAVARQRCEDVTMRAEPAARIAAAYVN